MSSVLLHINKSAPYFSDLRFVVQAVCRDKDITRYTTIGNINIRLDNDGGTIIEATDGHRAHMTYIPDCDIAPGQYTIRKSTKLAIELAPVLNAGKFPNIDLVFIRCSTTPVLENTAFVTVADWSRSVAHIARLGSVYNWDFFRDLDGVWEVYYTDAKTPLYMLNGNKLIAIMPVRE